jgi:Cytochrome P460
MMVKSLKLVLLILSLSGAIGLSLAARAPQAPQDGPAYVNGNSLVRPRDYPSWAFLGAGLGLTYQSETAGSPAEPRFSNVFVNPSSHRAFLETGKWPNGTVFILEARRSQTAGTPLTGGRFQGDLVGIEAEVKDSRFPDGWAFFNFLQRNTNNLLDVAEPLSGDALAPCVLCHTEHTAVERTFVQFYPRMLEVARQKGTVKPGFQ